MSIASLARPYEYRGLALGNLGLPDSVDTPHNDWPSLLPAAAASALRSGVWAASGAETDARDLRGIHVVRLLNIAARLLVPLTPEGSGDSAMRDLCRDTLADLERLGELVRAAGGYWLPAPLRAIETSTNRDWLLIGGIPSSRLRSVHPDLRHVGLVRACSEPGSGIYRQPLDDWLAKPRKDLQSWFEDVLRSARWLAFDGSEDEFEIYTPRRGDYQSRRWQQLARRFDGDVGLLRRRSFGAEGNFLLGRFNRARLSATYTVPANTDVRRVCYALDARAGLPTRALFDIPDETSVLIILRDGLPTPELRLFTAFASVVPNSDGRFYPRRWRVRREYANELIEALRGLRVDLAVSSEASRISARTLDAYGVSRS